MTKILLREWGALRDNILIDVGAAKAMINSQEGNEGCFHEGDEVLLRCFGRGGWCLAWVIGLSLSMLVVFEGLRIY